MHRIGNVFEKITDPENLYYAYTQAKKGKGWYAEVKIIDQRPWYYVAGLKWMMENGKYHTSDYTMQLRNESGKLRELYKLPFFPDRVAQWAILAVTSPDILKSLTADTYSALPGRGISGAFKAVRDDMDFHPEEVTECCKIDSKQFYASIDHDLLKTNYRRKYKDPKLLAMTDEIADSISTCPATPENIQWYRNHGKVIRLIYHDGRYYIDGVGIPIGNYISQWDGNFFLSGLDHYCKEILRIPHYYRYMDDIVFFAPTKAQLVYWLDKVQEYLSTELHLRLKGNYQIFPTFVRGVDFVGYRFFKDYTLLRKSTCQTMKRRTLRIYDKCVAGGKMTYHDYCCVNSYQGLLKCANCRRLADKYIAPLLPFVDAYYEDHIKPKKKRKKGAERKMA